MAENMKNPEEFDRIRSLLVRYAARLQDKNEEPPGPYLVAFAMLQAVDLLDVLAGSLTMQDATTSGDAIEK